MSFYSKKKKEDETVELIDSQLYKEPQDMKTLQKIHSIADYRFSVALLKIRMEKMDDETLLRANKTIRCLQLHIPYDR